MIRLTRDKEVKTSELRNSIKENAGKKVSFCGQKETRSLSHFPM